MSSDQPKVNKKLEGYDAFRELFKSPKFILAPMVYTIDVERIFLI